MAIAGIMEASPASLQDLVANSPFGKAPAASAASGTAADAPLEFRGVFSDAGESFFSLYDVASRRATWVGLKESGNPFVVLAYDEAKGVIEVEYQGQVRSIGLKQAKVTALPVAPLPSVPASPAQGNAVVVPPAVSTAPPADDTARLVQIAEEIRRRRALRVQAMQQAASNANTAQPPRPATP